MNSLVGRKVANGHVWAGHGSKGLKPYIIGVIVAVIVLFISAAGLVAFCCLRRRRSKDGAGAEKSRDVRIGGLFGRLGGYARIGDAEKPQAEQAWADVSMPTHASQGYDGLDLNQETEYHKYSDGGALALERRYSGGTIPPPYNVAVQGAEAQGADITDLKVEHESEQWSGGGNLEVSSGRRPRANSKFIEQIE